MGMVSHRGLSFSELGVLMSTPSSEKDSLLRLPVPVKIAPKFLKKRGFYCYTLYFKICSIATLPIKLFFLNMSICTI